MLDNTTEEQDLPESSDSWAEAIESALLINIERLGTPEGSLGDLIRLIKMSREFGYDAQPEPVHSEVKSCWLDSLEDDDETL